MFVSCICCPKESVRKISNDIQELKQKYKIWRFAEIKWTKVTKGKVEYYKEYSHCLGKDMEFIEIETTVNNEKSLLVIGDETADCLIPFLTKHYSRIDIVSADNFGEIIDKYTNKSEYEQTLFILGMEHISEKYRGE